MAVGYIRLHRQIQDHPIWTRGPASFGQAWVDLLMLAAWEPHSVHIKGETMLVERGDVVTSIRFLMKRWTWGSKKTQLFVRCLERDQMVSQKRHGSGRGSPSVFSIVNYDTYQADDDSGSTVQGTDRSTVRARLGHETKKVKKVKNKDTNSPLDGFEQFWKAYPKRKAKDAAEKAWRTVGAGNGLLPAILAAVETQKSSVDWKREDGRFIPYPATWLNQRRWQDEPTQPVVEDLHAEDAE